MLSLDIHHAPRRRFTSASRSCLFSLINLRAVSYEPCDMMKKFALRAVINVNFAI